MQPISVQFSAPRCGWIEIVVACRGERIPIHSSSVFDPYPEFLIWLEHLLRRELPARWHIFEEDSYIDLVAERRGAACYLTLSGKQRGDEYEDDNFYIFMDEEVDLDAVAETFYCSFHEMLRRRFDPKEWASADLRLLDWSRVDKYFAC